MKLADLSLIVATAAVFYADPSLATALTDAGDDLSNYTVSFGGGGVQEYRFVMTDGLVIPESDSIYNIIVDNLCNCRMACWSLASCLAASLEPFEGKFLCRLSTKSPVDTDLKILGNATYFFFTSAIGNRFYGIESDGFLYLLPSYPTYWSGYSDASAFCRKIPGHHLGLYDTPAQVQAIEKLQQWIQSPYNRVWTDFELNGNKQYFYVDGKYNNIYPSAGVVCQANPFGQN